MHRRSSRLFLYLTTRLCVVLSLALLCYSITARSETARVAIIDVNVLPMDSERILRRQTVLTEGDQIVAIGPVNKISVPADAVKVTGGDHTYLLPGLADMHTHVEDPNDLILYTANGVTTILQMGSATYLDMIRMKEVLAERGTITPKVYSSYLINGRSRGGGPFVASVEQAREAVRLAKLHGYEFIKLYNDLGREQFIAVTEEARAQGLTVVGHGVRAVGLPDGLFQGQAMVVHAEEFYYNSFKNQIDESLIPAVVAATRRSGAYVTPNVSAFAKIAEQWGKPHKVTEYLADPRARVISPSVRLNWTRDWRSQRSGDISPVIAFLQTFTKALHEAGVPLLMGTDSPPIPGIYAGYSVHDDLHYLHAAGLTNYETLVAATRNAGDFIVKSVPGAQRFGQLKVGMRADAVLVNGNPFDSLEVLKTPSGVLSGGRWTSARALGEKIEAQRKLYQSLY